MAKKKTYNRHHRIAKNVWGTDWPPNVFRMDEWKHNAWHRCFWTDWPASQILEILKVNEPILWKEFLNAELDLLDLFQWNYYKKEAHNWDKVYKRDTGNLYTYVSK